jgi:hypothetical protein
MIWTGSLSLNYSIVAGAKNDFNESKWPISWRDYGSTGSGIYMITRSHIGVFKSNLQDSCATRCVQVRMVGTRSTGSLTVSLLPVIHEIVKIG